MLGAFLELLLPLILAYIVDTLVPIGEISRIVLWGGVMILASIGAWVTNIAANRMASWVSAQTVREIRHDLFVRIMNLSARQVDNFTVPSLESRLTTDTYNLHRFIGSVQRLGVRAPMLFLGGIIFCFIQEWRLALILLLLLPPIAVLLLYISKNSSPRFRQLQRNIDQMVRVVRENIQGIRVIKSLDKVEFEKEHFAESNLEVAESERDANLFMSITNPAIDLILNTGLALVLIIGGIMVYNGQTMPGVIIAFLSYFIQITNALMSLNRMLVIYNRSAASAERIEEVLDSPEAKEQKILPFTEELQKAAEDSEYAVEFDNVTFTFGGEPALKDISFRLKEGHSLGIIGATGSGKSTLINLLLRHYDVSSGQIRLNGRPLKTIPLNELHQKFGIVYQNDFLYADTVRNNIDFGRDFTDEQLIDAAENAQALEFINEKEGGLDFRLEQKGVNLSGGQKQRVLLSRAMSGDPEILILDDSSSALDFATDARLRRALADNYTDTTTIIVAQRISAIQHCEHILFLADGEEIGYGTHEELLQSSRLYREIAEQQMGGIA